MPRPAPVASMHELGDLAVFGAALGVILADVAHQCSVGNGIDDGIALAGVDVPAPDKVGHDENVVARPFEPLAAYLGGAAAFDYNVKGASGFTLELGLLARAKQLRRIVQALEHRLSRDRVDKIHFDALVRIAFFFA